MNEIHTCHVMLSKKHDVSVILKRTNEQTKPNQTTSPPVSKERIAQ